MSMESHRPNEPEPHGRAGVPAQLIGALAALMLLLLYAQPAVGQGSGVYTHSACMNARNGAGIAQPCDDGSAIYYNPAALALQNGAVSLGVSLIDQSGRFEYDTTGTPVIRDPSSTPVPHAWASYRLNDRLGVGLGLWAPYGLSLEWPVCAGDEPTCGTPNFEGRFVGYEQSLQGLYLQPTIAYDLLPGRLALGGGLDIVRGDVEINRRLDVSEVSTEMFSFAAVGVANNTDFADVRLSGDGWGVTGHVGALFQLTDWASLGARYMHEVTLDMEGTADFRQISTGLVLPVLPVPGGPPLTDVSVDALVGSQFEEGGAAADQDIVATFTLPAQAVIGLALDLDESFTVMFDYQWTQWSAWDSVVVEMSAAETENEVLILDYQDASTYRLGADYRVSDQLRLHAGASYNEPAAKDASVSPFLPDSERLWLSGGVSYRLSERFSLQAFGMSADVASRRGRVVDRTSFEQTAEELNEGLYSAESQIYGATVTYHFGGAR